MEKKCQTCKCKLGILRYIGAKSCWYCASKLVDLEMAKEKEIKDKAILKEFSKNN